MEFDVSLLSDYLECEISGACVAAHSYALISYNVALCFDIIWCCFTKLHMSPHSWKDQQWAKIYWISTMIIIMYSISLILIPYGFIFMHQNTACNDFRSLFYLHKLVWFETSNETTCNDRREGPGGESLSVNTWKHRAPYGDANSSVNRIRFEFGGPVNRLTGYEILYSSQPYHFQICFF